MKLMMVAAALILAMPSGLSADPPRRDDRGPKFCQNGQGHPVHGRRWCAEKGFGRYGGWRIDWDDRVVWIPRRR